MLTVPDITDDEKWDKFCNGLKYEIRLEIMKANVSTFDEAAQIALRVDSALWGANMGRHLDNCSTSRNFPTPMEIGNVEKDRRSEEQVTSQQRQKELRNNACFYCHKVGCRPWKHRQRRPSVSNIAVNDLENIEQVSDNSIENSSSEN